MQANRQLRCWVDAAAVEQAWLIWMYYLLYPFNRQEALFPKLSAPPDTCFESKAG